MPDAPPALPKLEREVMDRMWRDPLRLAISVFALTALAGLGALATALKRGALTTA